MRYIGPLIICIVLVGCTSQQDYQAAQDADSAAKKTMLLDYGTPTIAALYRPASTATPFNLNNARIGIAKIDGGRLEDLKPSSTTSYDSKGSVITMGYKREDHDLQIATWKQFAAAGQARKVVFIPTPDPAYPHKGNVANFQDTLAYIQQTAVYNQLDYVIIYESTFEHHEKSTAYGDAITGTMKHAPLLAIPTGVIAIAVPIPVTSHTKIGYTDAFVVDMHTSLFQKYRHYADIENKSSSIAGLGLSKRDLSEKDAKINESFEAFYKELTASGNY